MVSLATVIAAEVEAARFNEEAAERALRGAYHLDFIREGVLLALYARDRQVRALIALLRWNSE